MICASLYRAVFIKNLLRYLAEKILLLNTNNFRGDYPPTTTNGVESPLNLTTSHIDRLVEAGRFVTEPIKWSYTGSLSLILIPLSLKDLDGCLPLPLAPHKTRHYTSAEDAAAI
jgi:hypothetical protein